MQLERLWTVADVAEYIGVTERTVRTWQRTRRLPFLRIGGAVRFREVDVVSWVVQFEESSAERGRPSAGTRFP